MSEVVGRRFIFRWVAKDAGAFCHQMRCQEPAVAHRLCAKHGAYWLSRGRQPPMPEYEKGSQDMLIVLENDTLDAIRERKTLGAMPMRNFHDAEKMKGQLEGAQALIRQTRQKRADAIRPLLAAALKIRAAHNKLIAAYRDCEAVALERLEQMDHLHDFEVAKPSKSGFPPRPQSAPKKKSGRGRKRA